ncbi:MAG: ssDNA-binding domain-containing protein [Prevotellaceae bacterium]|jgi:hypothetical protein|nr:ssDNA-binding domain-containing protein [Prevotellaceae bacterium]
MKNYSKNKISEKRDFLKKLSEPLKIRVKLGQISSINQGVLNIYRKEGHQNLKTIAQWNRLGMVVKKGEKALLLWATPLKKKNENEETGEITNFEYFPICYLFSEKQVENSNKTNKN